MEALLGEARAAVDPTATCAARRRGRGVRRSQASSGTSPVKSDTSTESGVVVVNQGVPGAQPTGPAIEPENVDAAIAAITQAFHDAFDGGTPDERPPRRGAGRLDDSRRSAGRRWRRPRNAASHPQQLTGISIEVLGTTFVDRTHAVVHFTLSIPDHGPVLVDQVGVRGLRQRALAGLAADRV